MEKISSVVSRFKLDNPTADYHAIIVYLKSLGYSEKEIKDYFYKEIKETIESATKEDIDEPPEMPQAEPEICQAMPDLPDPFDLPDDIKDEISEKEV